MFCVISLNFIHDVFYTILYSLTRFSRAIVHCYFRLISEMATPSPVRDHFTKKNQNECFCNTCQESLSCGQSTTRTAVKITSESDNTFVKSLSRALKESREHRFPQHLLDSDPHVQAIFRDPKMSSCLNISRDTVF